MKSGLDNNAEFRKEVFFVYVKFRRHFGDNKMYSMLYGIRESSLLDNFFKILEKNYEFENLGSEFFVDYFYFHFDFWHGRDTIMNNGGVPFLNWCVGKKGFSRWKNRSKSWKYFARKKLGTIPDDIRISLNLGGNITRKVDKISSSSKISVNFKESHFLKLNSFEEQDKKLFYGKSEGYLNCIAFTTLYNRKSMLCVRCKFTKKCRMQLKQDYPEIYEIRNVG